MKLIKTVQNKVTSFVKKRGGVLPKIFVWLYAYLFIGCGIVAVAGIIYEFYAKGQVNYKAVNEFIHEYFAPSIAGTMAVIGVLLIDKDHDGVPDSWQKEVNKDDKL